MIAQDGLGLVIELGLDPAALVGDPAVELAPADRPAPQLGRHVDRALIAHLGYQPQAALPDGEGVLGARLEAEGLVERDDLAPAARAAVPPTAQLDLAGEGHQATRGPAIGLHRPAAGRAGDRRLEGGLQAFDQLPPERHADLRQGCAHRPLERADVRVLRRKADLDRHRTLHPEPLSTC
ncbi:MAG TPA: hypothetical protein VLH36_02325 [Steroidobacteraceae bacterium]|nr:hypothetical protein [Steroidobacteraceae bacterium]